MYIHLHSLKINNSNNIAIHYHLNFEFLFWKGRLELNISLQNVSQRI